MKKFTSLLLTATLLLFCNWADAQNSLPKKPVNKNSVFALMAKERVARNGNKALSKKEIQKKLATYTYISYNEQTGQINDTLEKYTLNWGTNGMPVSVILSGYDEDIVEGQLTPYKVTYTDFVKVKESSESEFFWLDEGSDFDAKSGVMQIYKNNTWQNFAKLEKTISNDGFLNEVIVSYWLLGAWVNQSKEIYTYDSKGNNTETIEQTWQLNKWVNDTRWMEFYDADGRSTGYEQDEWDNNQWVATYGSKMTYTKNASNQVVEALMEQIDENGSWTNNTKQSYEVNTSGEITKATEQRYIDGVWENATQYKNITWKSFDASYPYWSYPIYIGGGMISSYETFYYNTLDSTWIQAEINNNIYSGNNLTERNTMNYNGTSWDTTSRTTYTYYADGETKETKSWYKDNGVWVMQYAYGSNNTYDNDGDITKSTRYSWDRQTEQYIDESIELYTYTNVTVGLANNSSKNRTVNVYPNPATGGNITIALNNNYAAKTYITIYDYTGKAVMQRIENAGNVTLDVNALPKGIYIININQGGEISKAQFIIQ